MDKESLVWAFLDGDLSEKENVEFNTLLNSDVELRSYYEQCKRIDIRLEEAKYAIRDLSQSSKQRAHKAIAQKIRPKTKISFYIIMVSLLVLGGCAVIYYGVSASLFELTFIQYLFMLQSDILMYISAVSFSIFLLIILDTYLYNRNHKNNQISLID